MTEEVEATVEVADEEVFVPDQEAAWTAKPLSIKRTVELVRLLAATLTTASMKLGDLSDEGEITEENVLDFLTILDENVLSRILCLITELSPEEVEETFTLVKAVDVVLEFWEQNDFSEILTKVGRLSRNQEFRERHTG